MHLFQYNIVGIFIIFGLTVAIGLNHFTMDSDVLVLTNQLFVYATTTNISDSKNLSEMNQNSSGITDIVNSNLINNSSSLEINIAMSEEDRQRFCGSDIQNSNSNFYVKEFVIPVQCSQPVGLAVDKDNNVWIASGKLGSLIVYNTKTLEFDKIIKIPNWQEQTRIIGSMIWEMKFDKNGDLWFTDELSNSIWKYFVKEGKFENYRLLEEGGYPLSITFDSDDNVWFTQVFGKRLGFIEAEKVITNTTEGISELDMSRQFDFQTMGSISNGFGNVNSNSNVNLTDPSNVQGKLWFSTATFPVGGQVIEYDIAAEALTIHDVTYTHSVPFSIAEDENGLLWVNSHIANLFFSLNPDTGEIKHYATSNPSVSGNLTTLPYYNVYHDGKVWFNEHYGNAIASYDPKNNTLVEYYIPSQNPLWVNSSNPLRFTFDNNGSIWFTEWTENKLGMLAKDRLDYVPITLEVSKDRLVLDSKNNKSDTLDIYIYENKMNSTDIANLTTITTGKNTFKNIENPMNITMDVTSSIAKNGRIDNNLTSSFSKDTIAISENSTSEIRPLSQLKTTLEVNPKADIIPGNYTLTISAKYGKDITVSKMVDLEIR